jgi:hypothetical protein
MSSYCMCIKSFYEKSTCRLAYVKKMKFGVKNKAWYETCFIFFTPVFHKTLGTHVDYRDIHVNFC